MLDRKRKTKDPCVECSLHKDLCLCELIPRLDLKTKMTLVVHYKELKRTTNTGTLALKALVNSEVRIRGKGREGLDLTDLLIPQYRTLLFFPSEDAVELNSELIADSSFPIQLIVPDGNWRQASKVHYRHHELKDIPRVMISTPNLETFHMRAETTDHGMATLQAIALAMGVIEGHEVETALMNLYKIKLDRTLKGRGQIPY
jgi:DTW domain-containing protein YfiP